MQVSDPAESSSPPPSREAEAARYALMRRLAPSMRHHLVVNLQPIGMIYEVMDRRLRATEPDLAHVQDSANKINAFARAALASSTDVVGWLAPDETIGIAVEDAVRECAGMLATSLSFRGYALRNEVALLPGQVRRSVVRSLLTGVLLHVTDHLEPPAALVVTAQAQPEGVSIGIAVRPSDGDKGFSAEAGYRKLEWRDLEAMAAAEGAGLARVDDGLAIQLPWLAAA